MTVLKCGMGRTACLFPNALLAFYFDQYILIILHIVLMHICMQCYDFKFHNLMKVLTHVGLNYRFCTLVKTVSSVVNT